MLAGGAHVLTGSGVFAEEEVEEAVSDIEEIKEEVPAVTREDAELDALLGKLTPAEYVCSFVSA